METLHNLEEAIAWVASRPHSYEWAYKDVVWFHPNAEGTHTRDSVYAASKDEALRLYATCLGQAIGYDWAWE